MLFSLGEMVTATQSVGDETFELLAEEGDNALWQITACDAGRGVGS